jgi:hypothetical protein
MSSKGQGDKVTMHHDPVLFEARSQYYKDLAQAAKELIENLKRELQAFEDKMSQTRMKYDQAVKTQHKGLSVPPPDKKVGKGAAHYKRRVLK